MTMRSEDDVRAEYGQLRAKLEAALRRKARSRQGSPTWEEAEREIGKLGDLGTALGWVLEEVDDIETPHFRLPEQAGGTSSLPLGDFWHDQLSDLQSL